MPELEALKLLRQIEEGVAGKTGDAFFRQIVRDLAGALDAHAAFTSRLLPERRARMLAFWLGGEHSKCLEYSLAGTPCEWVYSGKITCFARDVGDVFPVDREWFRELGVVSYLGIPVTNEAGEVRGHLAVMDRRERDWREADVDVLRLFSLRAAAEIERTHYQHELEQANSALRAANEQLAGEIARRRAMEGELASARDAAEAANRAKSVFISQMSHELRTPLNGILGYAQVLRQEESLPAAHMEGLAVIERSGQHLLNLVNDLLDLARIEAGRLELKPEPLALHEVLRHVADLARVRASRASQSFELELDPAVPRAVVCDERALRQILLNLLGNAIKFTDPGGRIRLAARSAVGQGTLMVLELAVSDSGIGIPPEECARIFEPFHRVEATDRAPEGTGLGLAITRHLVDALGGEMGLASRPGEGSTFTVRLALPVCELPRRETPERRAIAGYDGPRRTVLVADDHADNRALIVRVLGGIGFEVRTAVNGREALRAARAMHPDLLITDLVMPELDGTALIRALRAEPAFDAMPIVALSASATEAAREEAMQAGCNAFLTKPIALPVFFDELASQLRLNWSVRRHGAPDAAGPRSEEAPSEGFRLDASLADELHHLAMLGDVRGLLARAEETLAEDPAARELHERIQTLAECYDIRGIRGTIRRYRAEGESRSGAPARA